MVLRQKLALLDVELALKGRGLDLERDTHKKEEEIRQKERALKSARQDREAQRQGQEYLLSVKGELHRLKLDFCMAYHTTSYWCM